MNAPDAIQQAAPDRPPLAIGVVSALVALKLLLHLATNALGPYEIHRDAFLYMAMGEHLRLFGMDFPPAIAMLSEATRALLGDSLFALRVPIALFSTGLLLLGALTARELGGGRFAQGMAALAVLANLLFLRSGNLFQPVVMDQFWWPLGLFALVKLARTEEPRWWIVFGLSCGLGLLTKFSMLIFGFAVFLALLATPARKTFATRWPWLAAGIAIVLGSPSFIGQIRLGWPLFDQMGDLRSAQLARVSGLEFIGEQILMGMGFILAVIGIAALTFAPSWRRYRVVGWTGLFAFLTLLVLKGKSYYIGPIYPVLYGAGAVVLERFRMPRWGALARWVTVVLVASWGAITLPLGLPVLAPPTMERYLAWLSLEGTTETNIGRQERLPQDYADMLNWREQVEEVARVYNSLPADERERAVIFASNYGEAGAIDFYGPRYGLPKAIAVTGTYWFFGPGDLPGEIVIFHGFDGNDLDDFCGSLEAAGYITHPYAVAEQRDLTVYVCRDTRTTLQELWPQLAGNN
ncbi:MAG: glycosyltransferase family 39 protein [Gemmatimonadota bacterium]|nr:MAG: glycosyltransferase family 39 protein [Gemmatimonadota bacterium]